MRLRTGPARGRPPMEFADIIIVGGGPAGSTCAWKLREAGADVLLLDKQAFPREKLCAGWLTPRCARDLNLTGYPHVLIPFKRFRIRFRGVPLPLPTRQYSVRRYELDDWLLRRAGVPVQRHHVRRVERAADGFLIDGRYRCRVVVGAGGTACPVYRSLFAVARPRAPADLIVSMESEFLCEPRDTECRLWFCDNGLPGYAWYVPKGTRYVNVGVGGYGAAIRNRGQTIAGHWDRFTQGLVAGGLLPARAFDRTGYAYFLRRESGGVEDRGAFLVGDAAGVATRDMGEGIGPSVESAMLAASSILTGKPYSLAGVTRYSLPGLLSANVREPYRNR